MGVKRSRFPDYSRPVIRSKRWPALRLQAKRRDGFKCVQCGAVGTLEVDHIKPVRDFPELAFELSNLQTLCARHHAQKTRQEIGLDPMDPRRRAWRVAVRELTRKSPQLKEL